MEIFLYYLSMFITLFAIVFFVLIFFVFCCYLYTWIKDGILDLPEEIEIEIYSSVSNGLAR